MHVTDNAADPSRTVAAHGVIVRARNGDLIGYDGTGVVMRLSDRVIDDIALRLGTRFASAQAGAAPSAAAVDRRDLPDADRIEQALDGLDVWNLRAEGDWLRFSGRLPGRQGPRDFLRCLAGGGIVADAPGPLTGILGIGGPRAALADPRAPAYPHHVLAPDDDIGAVGHAGTERAGRHDLLAPLREVTHEALMAEALLDWQMDKHAALPAFVTRVETDSSVSAGALAQGMAVDNLLEAAANIRLAAARLGKPARILAVTLDFALESLDDDPVAYRDGMLALMDRITAGLRAQGYDSPVYVARMDAGRPGLISDRIIAAQWELAWNKAAHDLVISAPSYMFAQDEFDRPTPAARRHMAEMSAAAVTAAATQHLEPDPMRDGWRCPVFHLAELDLTPRPDGGATLRVIARALDDLSVHPAAAAGSAAPLGFALDGADNDARIVSVTVDQADPQTLILHLNRQPQGADLRLRFGYGDGVQAPVAVRDGWELTSADGRMLHRWALPCCLPVHPGGSQS